MTAALVSTLATVLFSKDVALAEGVLAETPNARENYLAFLKSGNSLAPLDALKLAGVDMTAPEPVDAAFRVLTSMVERLEQLLGVEVAA